MFTIESSRLNVRIQSKGAELVSIFHKEHRLEYLWNADPAFWAKKSPVLFPIVGTIKNDTYRYKGQPYQLSRHGFAREKGFTVTAQSADSITFSLHDDEETRVKFPFRFEFNIVYTVKEEELLVTYFIQNMAVEEMYFSVGGHPAFKVPLVAGTVYEDYELLFNEFETAGRWLISKEGLIRKEPLPFFHHTRVLPLTKELFKEDALVFKQLASSNVQLHSGKTPHGLKFYFEGFAFLGLWAAPGADFVCIEPWCGVADSVDSHQHLPGKEGIILLPAGETFERTWRVQFY